VTLIAILKDDRLTISPLINKIKKRLRVIPKSFRFGKTETEQRRRGCFPAERKLLSDKKLSDFDFGVATFPEIE
jgi:hypothetical protein